MLDNTALCKEEITQETLKDAHSERIRSYKMQFRGMEKKKKETQNRNQIYPHFINFVFWHVNS